MNYSKKYIGDICFGEKSTNEAADFYCFLSKIKKVEISQKKFQKSIDKPKVIVYNMEVVARKAANARVAELADAHV